MLLLLSGFFFFFEPVSFNNKSRGENVKPKLTAKMAAAAASILPLHTVTVSPFSPSFAPRSIFKTPQAVLHEARKMRVTYELKQGQSRLFHELPSGLNMEVIVQKGVVVDKNPGKRDKTSENPPLVFVHGSYHAAWCWAEHWLPFFSASGYDCYAISLLGQVGLSLSISTYLYKLWFIFFSSIACD